jgi:hypothetical protein
LETEVFVADSTALTAPARPALAGAQDIWEAMKQDVPEVVALAARPIGRSLSPKYADHPGFREWLLTEFALATPIRTLKQALTDARDEQFADGVANPWPSMNLRQLLTAREDLSPDWRPMRANLESRIRDIGVVNKNRRLLALQSLAEQLSDQMWDERDEKSGRLYLLPEYRSTLRAIAEEVGEIGVQVDERDTTIRGLVEMLSNALHISGMGVQVTTNEVEQTPFDYNKNVDDGDFRVMDSALDA